MYPYNRVEGRMGDRWDGDTGGISRLPRHRWDGDVSGAPPASPGGGGRLLRQHPLLLRHPRHTLYQQKPQKPMKPLKPNNTPL